MKVYYWKSNRCDSVLHAQLKIEKDHSYLKIQNLHTIICLKRKRNIHIMKHGFKGKANV